MQVAEQANQPRLVGADATTGEPIHLCNKRFDWAVGVDRFLVNLSVDMDKIKSGVIHDCTSPRSLRSFLKVSM